MTLEEKLRRGAALAGLSSLVLAVLHLAAPMLGLDFRPPMPAPIAAALILMSLALMVHALRRALRFSLPATLLALVLIATTLVHAALDGRLWPSGLLFLDFDNTGPAAAGITPDAGLALLLAGAMLLVLGRARHARRPASVWLASIVFALTATALAMSGLSRFTEYARPLHLTPSVAGALCLLSLGALLTRPDNQLLHMLLARTSAGALARRLFCGVIVMPVVLIGLALGLIALGVMAPQHAAGFLILTLVLAGLALAMFSAETAGRIDERHQAAEQEQARLNAVLEQQATRLQELVARRTGELRTLSSSLRATARENAQLGLVARNTTNGVIVTDAQGRLEWANAAFERMTGYSLAEAKGRKPGHFLQGPDTDPASIAQMRRSEQAGERCCVEVLNYTKSRHPYWQIVDMEPVQDAGGKLVNWIGILTDITAHRLAEQHLRTLNERLQLATQSAALGVWEWDAATQKHTWDERTLQIHGRTAGDFDGSFEGWMKCLLPEDRALAEARFQLVLAGGNAYDQEFRVVRMTDGAVRHVESRAIVQRDTQGRLVRITGTSRDITAERENAERLRTLTDRWQLALRASRYGVWDWNIESDRVIWDDRMFEIYGVARDTFPGLHRAWFELIHPEDRARAQQNEEEAMSQGREEFANEFRVVLPDGFVRHIETHGYIRRDEQGRPVRLVGMDRDITAEKQTLEALRMAEERWQLAVEGTNDGVWDWNIPTGVTYHDHRWPQMLGYEPGEIPETIESWHHLIHPDDLAGCLAATEEHFAQRTPLYQHEHRLRTKQGDWKWILDRGKVVNRSAQGRPLRMVGMHTDVTARKLLEQRLHQFEQLMTQVSDIAQIGGWEMDLDTMQITWSEQARRIHEVGEHYRPTVHSAVEFFAPEARNVISAAFKAAMAHGRAYDLELPLVTARGRRIWVRALARADIVDGRPARLIGAFQDISSRRDSEEARRKLEFQLFQAQKMETLGTLAGGIAHDFNNLLTGIMGYQELLGDTIGDNEVARDYLAQSRGASLRARELVEQILTFGRQSADDQHTPLDLAIVIEEARRLLRATIPATIAIETDIAPGCGPVMGDATQIHQVLINLGSNASHAMQAHGGVLRITLRPVDHETPRTAALATLPAGDYLRLSVSDTGHGIDDATLQRIFDPFFTTKEVREGTGLGLAVVHGIVRAHRGAIDVESTVGVGSTFHIYLPAAVLGSGDADQSETPQSPRGQGQMIYIVDDEDTVASFTKFALENKGYRAATLDTAVNCLEALRANPAGCAVLITDQTMPGMTGTELAGKVREFAPTLPIIVMSGYFLKIPPQDLAQIGQVELLGKPFTTDELAWMVHRALHPGETAPPASAS
jgi:PAS domain S-box-containing protein